MGLVTFLTHTAPYYVGSLWMLYVLYKVLNWIHVTYIHTNDLRKYRKNGAYAIVTGCTDGIGKGFAQELAKLKFNLFLISRSQEKLLALQTELESKYHIQTQIFQADASVQDETVYKTISERLASIPVTLLVNNVGISTDYPMPVAEMDPQIVNQMIQVNCSFPTRLTQVVVPHLRKHPNTCIINVASIVGVVSVPLLAVYSATKAYNRHFSNAIKVELAQYGIDVLAITPNGVESNMSKTKASLSVCSANRCATGSINKVGLGDASPYWYHSLEQIVLSSLPVWIRDKMTLQLTTTLRKHALQKLAQQQGNKAGDKKSR